MTAESGGRLIVKGHRSAPGEPMVADQIIETTGGGSVITRPSIGQLVYEEYPGSVSHRHWHYKGFVRYQLRSVSDLSLVRPDNKAGFCLSDPELAPDFCGSLNPGATEVNEGLTPGVSDYYNPLLEGQYIDVADVPPGDYWLVHWVNASKEICESDYGNNAAGVKIALWPNGYGVAPYFTVMEEREPFTVLFSGTGPPDPGCVLDPTPGWGPPDLVQKKPSELSVTPVGAEAPPIPPVSAPPTGSVRAPSLRKALARRYVVRALTQRFQRRPRQLRVACRRLGRASFVCRVRWHDRRYRYRGGVRIFTARTRTGFERRFNLRVLRTDTRCVREDRRGCSRTIEAKNKRFRAPKRNDPAFARPFLREE
ncbi:MAG: lysyl oxidase family protein [Thermoleophilia bacterium]